MTAIIILFLIAVILLLGGISNRWLAVAGLVLLLGVGAMYYAAARRVLIVFTGETMGTTYRISAVCSLKDYLFRIDKKTLKKKLDAELVRVNSLMSTYDPDSELSRLNKHQTEQPFPISEHTARVLGQALTIAQKTDGIYDPTVGPLVNLWRFGPEDRPEQIPADTEIQSAKSRVGWHKIKLIENPDKSYSVIKNQPDVYIDLSSIAKGFGVDCIAQLLQQELIYDYLIDIGGELRAGGKNADGVPWKVGVRQPNLLNPDLATVISLDNQSIATSGDYLNYFEENGKRYSHIINNQTGKPIEHSTTSVSVISSNCAWADGWATALLAAGEKQGLEIAKREKLDAAFIVIENGNFVIYSSR